MKKRKLLYVAGSLLLAATILLSNSFFNQKKIESENEDETKKSATVQEEEMKLKLEERYPDPVVRSYAEKMLDKEVSEFTLVTMNGDEINSSHFKGRPFIIEFAWSQCGACIETQSHVIEFKKQNTDAIVLQIFSSDTKEEILNFVNETGTNEEFFSNMLYGENGLLVAEEYNVQFVPTFVYVDEGNVIRDVSIGVVDKETIQKSYNVIKTTIN